MNTKKIETGVMYREAALSNLDEEKRTVELSFSSEMPVKRYFGFEILSHEPGHMRMDRLNSGAPLLLHHNSSDQIGVVENASIGQDRKGRALVRFSKSPKAEEIFQDVKDEIRKNVSVGYAIHRMILEEVAESDTEYYRAVDWEPYEISLEPIPADISVGVGRSGEDRIETIIETRSATMEPKTVEQTPPVPPVDIKDIQSKARKEELDRVREISAIGEKHGFRDMANEFINSGKAVEEFRMEVLEKIGTVKKVDTRSDIGMSDKEVKEFSFMRAINALAAGNRALAPLEFEASDEVGKKMGRPARGFFVPMDVLTRDLTKGSATAGGNLVGTDHLAASFIEVLRNKMLIRQLGAIVLDGLIGDVAIPSQTAATTAYWVTEGNPPTEGAPTFGKVSLSPKTVGAYVDMSRKLLLQSSPAIEQLIRNDLASQLAIGIDYVAINGASASDQPVGILQTTGIGAVAGGTDGAAPTWANLVALETEVAIDNADIGNLAYLTNPKVRGKLKNIFTNATYGEIPVWQNGRESGVGMVNGYDAYVTNQVPSTLVKNSSGAVCSAIIFGNFADLILGFWGALDVNIDTSVLATSGGIRVLTFQDADVAVRHAASFAAMQDALTT